MSWENLKDAYRTRLGNLTAKSVLVLTVDEANAEGLAFLGVERVAMLTEINKRTTLRILQVFGEIDLVTKTEATLKGKLLPAFQVNLARLGLDLREPFREAYLAAQSKGAQCRRDTGADVAATSKTVAATRRGVAATFPPHPHIGGPPVLPFVSPTPIVPSGEGTGAVEAAVDQVCSALGISNRRKRKLIRFAVELAAEKGELPATIALAMIAAVRKQGDLADRGLLKFAFGLEKFLGLGIWRDENRWGWDNDALKLRREASVGTWR